METSKEQTENLATIKVDLKCYSLEAVQKVAYWYSGKCFVELRQPLGDLLEVVIKAKDALPLKDLPRQFMNDLLDQTLREKVAKETEAFRNLIIAHALSKTSLIRPELETEEPGFGKGSE